MAASEIDWRGADADWDGADRHTLKVPHSMRAWPTNWLRHNLPERLGALLPHVEVEADCAVWEDDEVVSLGDITIHGIELPLLQIGTAQELRRIVEEAADEADVAAEQAAQHVDALLGSLGIEGTS